MAGTFSRPYYICVYMFNLPGFIDWHMRISIVNKQFNVSLFSLQDKPIKLLCPYTLKVIYPNNWSPSGIYKNDDVNCDWGYS